MTAHASIFRSAWVSLVQLVCVCLGLRRSVVVCIGLYVFVTYGLVLVYDNVPACSAELNSLPEAVTTPSSNGASREHLTGRLKSVLVYL